MFSRNFDAILHYFISSKLHDVRMQEKLITYRSHAGCVCTEARYEGDTGDIVNVSIIVEYPCPLFYVFVYFYIYLKSQQDSCQVK